jgi:mono/diheme cytochrome c family protein
MPLLRRTLQLSLFAVALAPALTALGGGSTEGAPLAAALADAQALYAMNCSVCHGPTGGGLAEARLVFPPVDRNCSHCHKSSNPVVQPLTKPFVDNNMFPVGNPPPLRTTAPQEQRGEATAAVPGVMASVTSPEALFAYVKATMPRYDPGRHSDAEYWLLTAHLLNLNGRAAAVDEAVARAVSAGWANPDD